MNLTRINNQRFSVRFCAVCAMYGLRTIHSAKKYFSNLKLDDRLKVYSHSSATVSVRRLLQELNEFEAEQTARKEFDEFFGMNALQELDDALSL